MSKKRAGLRRREKLRFEEGCRIWRHTAVSTRGGTFAALRAGPLVTVFVWNGFVEVRACRDATWGLSSGRLGSVMAQ